ncbi:MAG: family 43 glycosylhydrolase [Eubacterium sp.]|nr:family 43 glycosylhydrolase [Eubacterium sp.]
MRRKIIAVCLSAAVILSALTPGGTADAAAKPKLKTKKISVSVKKSKTIKITKKGKFKISFQSKNKKIAKVSSKGKVTGQKKGRTKVIVYYKKGKAAKKKLGTVSVTVTSKTTPAPVPAPTASAVPPAPTPNMTNPPAPSQTPGGQTSETPTPTPEGPTPMPTLDPNNLATVNYPTLYSDIPDLDIIRQGDAYYMVSTTMNMCPGVPIMKSTDLAHWQIVNYVYDTFENDDIANLNNGKNMYKHGSWAASLKYNEAEGKYYVAFNSNDHGFYIYTTTDIEKGTWTKYSTKNKYHDPALFFDEGKMYVFSGSTLQQLELDESSNAVKPVGSSVKLFTKDDKKWGLWEGAHAYKVGDYYYLFIIASPQSGWMRTEVCYRSKTLEAGDWEEQIIYQGGCGGNGAGLAQGGIVDTQYGDWYGFLFQDHGGVGRIPSIVSVNWNYTDSDGNSYEDWPMMGTYDADGNFTPSKAEDSVQINLNDSGLENYFVDDDDFTYAEGDKLKLVWQWNHNPQNDFWSVTDNPGYLRLTTDRVVDNIMFAHNSLTQRTYGPSCKSETKISIGQMKPGDFAGLASVSDKPAMIGVMCDENGDKYITQASSPFPTGTGTETKINGQAPEKLSDDTEVYLKIEYSFSTNANQDKANFFYSLDGTNWTKLGTEQKLGFSTSTTFMGTRTFLFNYATKEAGGYVDFDYYKIYD